VQDFTALLRANPGRVDYATCGVATAPSLRDGVVQARDEDLCGAYSASRLLARSERRGRRQIDVVVASLAAVMPFARQGRLRIVGLTSKERSPNYPEGPTFRESGIPELKDFEVENYYGFAAPSGTPRDVQMKIEADIRRVMSQPELVNRLNGAGLDPFQKTPAEMTAILRSDIAKFQRAIEVAGIKPE